MKYSIKKQVYDFLTKHYFANSVAPLQATAYAVSHLYIIPLQKLCNTERMVAFFQVRVVCVCTPAGSCVLKHESLHKPWHGPGVDSASNEMSTSNISWRVKAASA